MEHADTSFPIGHLSESGCFCSLTAVLVLTSKLFHEALSVWAMLVLTPLKAGLVFFFFHAPEVRKTFLCGPWFF